MKKGYIPAEVNKRFKQKVQLIIRKSKLKYFELSFENCKNNIKETWDIINNLKNSSKKNKRKIDKINWNNSTLTEDSEIANGFSDYFSSIAEDLRNHLPLVDLNPLKYVKKNNNSFFFNTSNL